MYKLRCPKCKAIASLPLVYTYSRLTADGKPQEEEPNVFCLACRYRWHTQLRFHPAF